jgi:SAM-dependent methyltransferase
LLESSGELIEERIDVRMSVLEKHFANSPAHTQKVDDACKVLSHIDCRSGWQYLDVGCGVGTAARKIATISNLSVSGIDIDPKQIEAAESGAAHANLQYKVMDATKLQFGDGAFALSHLAWQPITSPIGSEPLPRWCASCDRAVTSFTAILFFRHGLGRLPVLFVFWIFRHRVRSISWQRGLAWSGSTSYTVPVKWT